MANNSFGRHKEVIDVFLKKYIYYQDIKIVISSRSSIFYLFYIIFALYYTWIVFYFIQGGTGVPCPPLFALIAPSFDISGLGLMLNGNLFKYPCAGFGRLHWVCSGAGVMWRI